MKHINLRAYDYSNRFFIAIFYLQFLFITSYFSPFIGRAFEIEKERKKTWNDRHKSVAFTKITGNLTPWTLTQKRRWIRFFVFVFLLSSLFFLCSTSWANKFPFYVCTSYCSLSLRPERLSGQRYSDTCNRFECWKGKLKSTFLLLWRWTLDESHRNRHTDPLLV